MPVTHQIRLFEFLLDTCMYASCAHLVAVSYTHLDVYKRQVLYRIFCQNSDEHVQFSEKTTTEYTFHAYVVLNCKTTYWLKDFVSFVLFIVYVILVQTS